MSTAIKDTKRFYEKNGARWTDTKTNAFLHEKVFTEFVSLLPKKGSVIDIGCAAGIHAPMFLGIGRNLKYHGIDIAKSFLKIAQRRYPQLTFTEGDIAAVKTLPKKKFDGFWATAVLMHIPFEDWDGMFTNIEKITKPDAIGVLVLPTFHPGGGPSNTDQRHFTILSNREQKKYLRNRGWKILKSGKKNGSITNGEWCWHIVSLP